ncbi:hypothetical protein ACERIM_02170 [Natrinema sp. H-ect1]|uniref:hypothetical protein n=1 Tax=Natrinema sp. H-ect1 TaxID=3242700 RepID=UPI00359DBD5B
MAMNFDPATQALTDSDVWTDENHRHERRNALERGEDTTDRSADEVKRENHADERSSWCQ